MEEKRWKKYLDYFPLLAYFGFWLQGAAISSLITRDPGLIFLGIITAPAILALALAALRIRRA